MELDKELIQLRIDIIERNLEEIKKIVDEGYEKFKLERNLSEKLQEMAKFRNLLVHRYAETEKEKLFKIMKMDVDDIRDFIGRILRYIARE